MYLPKFVQILHSGLHLFQPISDRIRLVDDLEDLS